MTNSLTGVLLAAAAGLNAFLPILGLALADRFTDLVDLPQPYDIISTVPGIVILLVLVTVDLIADKIPKIDHLNDLVNSPIRPAAGMFLMMAAVSGKGDMHAVAAMFVGLLVAGAVHIYKSVSRTRITLASNGLANPMVSLIEDTIAGITTVLAITLPWLGLVFAVPAGIGLGWVYRKTSGDGLRSLERPVSEATAVDTAASNTQRRPKRAVVRRDRSKSPTKVSTESPDA